MPKDQPSTELQRLLADAHQLARRTSHRRNEAFWVEGIRHFIQAHDAHFRFSAIIESPILLKSPLVQMLARRLHATGVPRWRVSPEQFRAVSTAERASGIGAIVEQRWTPLDSAKPACGLCWLAIEHLRSPGNLGTILRTAEACGASGIIFLGEQVDPFAAGVVRASMGGVFHLPLVRTTPRPFAEWVKQNGIAVVGLSPDGDQLWTDLPQPPACLVVGEERQGLSPQLRALCKLRVRLPMVGRADSLNVSVAAGVVMYEFFRQRLGGSPSHEFNPA